MRGRPALFRAKAEFRYDHSMYGVLLSLLSFLELYGRIQSVQFGSRNSVDFA